MKETSTFQLDKGTGGGRSFGFFSKDPEQAKQDKRERVDSNIEEVRIRECHFGVTANQNLLSYPQFTTLQLHLNVRYFYYAIKL